MSSRILVADDSLTIQKVIGITLANSNYDITECLSEADLLKIIQLSQFDLILLDFNLSETISGYDLAKKINETLPNAAIMVMLGTFDSVDDSKFSSCAIADKIVKPFESAKFVKKVRDVLDSVPSEGVIPVARPYSEPEKEAVVEESIDSWVVEAPTSSVVEEIHTESIIDEASPQEILDPLSSEIKGWGFTPPKQTLEEKFHKSFPPVIEEASENSILNRLQSSSDFVDDNFIFDPSDDEEGISPLEFPLSIEDAAPKALNLEMVKEIEEEISPETFWAVDVKEVASEDAHDIEETHLQEITEDLTEKVAEFKASQEEELTVSVIESPTMDFSESIETTTPVAEPEFVEVTPEEKLHHIHVPAHEEKMEAKAEVDLDELVAKLKVALTPMLQEMVKEVCSQSAEKVAWEVIPDLAENLIRKEIKNLSDSIN
jgi:DNA-binding response OmpR family regulator